eukprot:1494851-Alexandrium_andersonii.AAC.1
MGCRRHAPVLWLRNTQGLPSLVATWQRNGIEVEPLRALAAAMAGRGVASPDTFLRWLRGVDGRMREPARR